MKPTLKLLGLLAVIVVLVASIVSVAQAANLQGTSARCPSPNGAACSSCQPDPRYPELYYCTTYGAVRSYNSTCTWWSSMELPCNYPEICDCVSYDYADHCASSCRYR